ncbi:LAFA_0F04676g1_1 [Lachancea sp. 'fantastica']|nr:LAFA_0F04676g1_1 [Lachancea sp. 'fantastica']
MVFRRSSTLDPVSQEYQWLSRRSQTVNFESSEFVDLRSVEETGVGDSDQLSKTMPIQQLRNIQRHKSDLIEYPKHTQQVIKRSQTISFPQNTLDYDIQMVPDVESTDLNCGSGVSVKDFSAEDVYLKKELSEPFDESFIVIESSQGLSRADESDATLDAEATEVWNENTISQKTPDLNGSDTEEKRHSQERLVHHGSAKCRTIDNTPDCDQTLTPNGEFETLDCTVTASPELTLGFSSSNAVSRGQTEELIAGTTSNENLTKSETDTTVSIVALEPGTFGSSSGENKSQPVHNDEPNESAATNSPQNYSSSFSATQILERTANVHKSLKHLILKTNQECFQVNSKKVRYRAGLSKLTTGLPHLHERFNNSEYKPS